MQVKWQVVSWPLDGGIDTKRSPVAVVPGSHIKLRNVRQDRDSEWRIRPGHTHDGLDDMGAVPIKEIGLPYGARVAMTYEAGITPAVRVYSEQSTVARWAAPQSPDVSQSSPSYWSRRTVASVDANVLTDYCEGAVYSLTAWAGISGVAAGLFARITNKVTGSVLTSVTFPGELISATGVRPRCFLAGNLLWLVYIDTASGFVIATAWNATTGAPGPVSAAVVGTANAIHYMDALYYGGTTATVAFRTSAANTRFFEFNVTTGVVGTNVLLGFDTDLALSLLPDPNVSGTRGLAVCTTVAGVVVLRISAAGATLTNETASAVGTLADQITGSMYQAGNSWQVVWHGAGGGIFAAKKRNAVIGAVGTLIPATHTQYTLNSVAWRLSSWDLMHYMVGIHAPTADAQDSYLEMALPFDTGSATIANSFPEPQARLLPLQAGPSPSTVYPGALPHAQDLGGGIFAMSQVRLGRIGRASGVAVNQYAIDAWHVTYPQTAVFASLLNQGQGTTTDSAGFIPVGSLLQSVHGEVTSHGLAAIPFKVPSFTPGAAGALTVSSTYQSMVVVEVPNAGGDVWRSPPSVPTTIVLGAAQTSYSGTGQISATELAGRVITIKTYRTAANGSLFRLTSSKTGLLSANLTYTIGETVSDAVLAGGEPYFGEVPATITPPMSHVVTFQGRLWGITRDFPELWMSKPLQKGLQPEFPGVSPFVVSLADENGEPTALYALDDKLMIHKERAVYACDGSSADNAGGGTVPFLVRLDTTAGSIVGSPVVSIGTEAYFISERGPHRVDRGGEVTYVGEALDLYFNQRQLFPVPVVVSGGCYSNARDEVRFILANNATFTAFVYDRPRGRWIIDAWNLATPVLSRMTPAGEIRYTGTGVMYREGLSSSTDDAGGAIPPAVIGTAWIQAASPQGRFRIKRLRMLAMQTPTVLLSSPTLKLFYNFDETGLQYPVAETAVPTAVIPSTQANVRAEIAPRNQKCTAFRADLTIVSGVDGGGNFRLEQWAAVIGYKKNAQKLNTSERWT